MYSFSSLSARGGPLCALLPLRPSIGTFAPFIIYCLWVNTKMKKTEEWFALWSLPLSFGTFPFKLFITGQKSIRKCTGRSIAQWSSFAWESSFHSIRSLERFDQSLWRAVSRSKPRLRNEPAHLSYSPWKQTRKRVKWGGSEISSRQES